MQNVAPSVSEALDRGMAAHRAGCYRDAEAAYAEVLSKAPENALALHLLGLLRHQSGNHTSAIELISRAIAFDSSDAAFYLNRGDAKRASGDLAGAIADTAEALRRAPGNHVVLNNLGALHRAAGEYASAIAALRQALSSKPDMAEAHNNLGLALQAVGDVDAAIASFQSAVALSPANAEVLSNLGLALQQAERWAEATEAFIRAVTLQPGHPDILRNLGQLYLDTGNSADAAEAFRSVIALKPDDAVAHNNLGACAVRAGAFEIAAQSFRNAIRARPDYPDAHRNLGGTLLRQEAYSEGWSEHAWRWRCRDLAGQRRPFRGPVWTGQPLGRDETLLIWSEQGLGEEILFASMAADAMALTCKVTWEVDPRLVPLLQRSYPAIAWLPRAMPPSPEALRLGDGVHIAAGDLGGVFRTARDRFPAGRGFLRPDPSRVTAFRTRLAGLSRKPAIGLSWRSQNTEFGAAKSMSLSEFAPAFAPLDAQFVDLQYGDTAADRAAARALGLEVAHLNEIDIKADIEGAAALTAACDAVVTVSNTAAHIAGALGISTHVIAPAGGAKLWYWGAGSGSTPWYPSLDIVTFDAAAVRPQVLVTVARRVAQANGL